MRWLLTGLFVLHGIAHLVGFVAPWRLAELEGTPYKTTVLGGTIDLGDVGIRLVGILWLIAAIAFIVSAIGILTGAAWWRGLALLVASASLIMTAVEWPEARMGLVVNLLILAVLIFGQPAGWLPDSG